MTNSATQAIRKTGLDFDAAEFATLSAEELRKLDADWRASNYLSVGQINLFDNPDLIVACVVGDGEAEVVRVFLPPDANTLLSVTDHCLRRRNYDNVVVAGKNPAPQCLTMDQAMKHWIAGLGIW